MLEDSERNRFLYLLFLFVSAMCFFIISANFLSIILGWEGLGLGSYLLITYYYSKYALNSGLVTLLSNRLGDYNLLVLMGFLFENYSWNYENILINNIPFIQISFIIIIIRKRAQMPFRAWLPLAIAAPTPVSSLVHSSTLVTAGVYLGFRNITIINSKLLLCISNSTLIISRILAIWEYDLKKIIALSTLRQIALIISSIILSSHFISFFHLITHAFFKSLIFLTRGRILHSAGSVQDIRFLSSNKNKKMTISLLIVSNMCLVGFPFSSGFYSKDILFENSFFNLRIILFILISVCITCLYTIKIVLNLIKTYNFNYSFRIEDSFLIYILIISCVLILISRYLIWIINLFNQINYIIYGLKKFTLMLIIILSYYFYFLFGQKRNFYIPKMFGLHVIRTKKLNSLINNIINIFTMEIGTSSLIVIQIFIIKRKDYMLSKQNILWIIIIGALYSILTFI